MTEWDTRYEKTCFFLKKKKKKKKSLNTTHTQVRVKCNEDDTVGDLKKLCAAQIGTKHDKLRVQKSYVD